MWADLAPLIACLLLTALVAIPALLARQRRHLSRDWSEVATALAAFAAQVRHEQRVIEVDDTLLRRLRALAIPERVPFELVCQLRQSEPEWLANAAERLSLRLKRRAAFERKMLARTASGRRRGALAAATPALVLLLARSGGVAMPMTALSLLVVLEILGCWMLWRVARVDV